MLSAREYGASLVFNGQMMVIGGYNDRNGWLDSVEIKVRQLQDPGNSGRIFFYLQRICHLVALADVVDALGCCLAGLASSGWRTQVEIM